MKFIKEILGVHSKATNVACRAELARTPIKTKIQFSAIKCLEHIVSSNNTLVNKIYVNTENSNTWISTIKDWLDKLGFAHLSLNPTNIKFYLKTIEQRIYDQAIQAENSVIAESSKLIFFSIHVQDGSQTGICRCMQVQIGQINSVNSALVPTD